MTFTIFFVMILVSTSYAFTSVYAQGGGGSENSGNFQGSDHAGSMEPRRYEFGENLAFQLQSQNNVSFSINYNESMSDRFLGIRVNNTAALDLEIEFQATNLDPPQDRIRNNFGQNKGSPTSASQYVNNFKSSPSDSNHYLSPQSSTAEYINLDTDFQFDTYFTLNFDSSKVEYLEIYSLLNYSTGFNQNSLDNFTWIYYDAQNEEWVSINSEIIDGGLQIDLSQDQIMDSMTFTIVKLSEESLLPTPDNRNIWFWILIVGVPSAIVIIGVVMTTQEYREFLLNRVLHIDKGAHRLTMEEVLENENRNMIIDLILERPGVHFNEILREIQLSAGNLAWHLDILETFKIVRKQRVGQYLLYYPYYEHNPISKLDAKLQKSRTTLEILQIVNDHPGIYQNQLAHRMSLDHKTIKYHLDKLLEAEVVWFEKKGRRKLYFPSDYIEKTE